MQIIQKQYHLKKARSTIYEDSLLSSVMIKQAIIQAALSSIETTDAQNKFKAWTESEENVAQISGQDTLHITFSKMTGSPLSSANSVKAQSPNLM